MCFFSGWVNTVHYDGLRFELGPRALSARRCPATLRLMEQLNLKPVPAEKLATVRYIYYEGRCVPLPRTPFDVFSCPLTKHLPRRVFSNFFRFRKDGTYQQCSLCFHQLLIYVGDRGQ